MNPSPIPVSTPDATGPARIGKEVELVQSVESETGAQPEPEPETAAEQAVRVDLVLGGRHMSTGAYLAGLMTASAVETAGRVDRLPRDLFPDGDPVLVQEVWERACAVAWRAAERYFTARQDPAVLAGLRAGLEEAGHHAMAGMVARSLAVVRTAGLAHPADGLVEREH
jgi:hypothetical protein